MLPYLLFALQVVNVTAALVLLSFVLLQIPGEQQKLMSLLCFVNLLIAIGNSVSLTFTGTSSGKTGVLIVFYGGTCISYVFMLVCASICRVEIYTRVKVGLMIMNLVVLCIALTNNLHHWFYKDIEIVSYGPLTLCKPVFGIGYYIYMAWHCMYFGSMLRLLRSCSRKNAVLFKHIKHSIMRFVVAGLIALIPFCCYFFFRMSYDITGIGCTAGTAYFIWTVYRNEIYPIKQNSQDIVLSEMEDMLIVYNSNFGFEYTNVSTTNYFYEIKGYPFGKSLLGVSKRFDSVMQLDDGETITLSDREYQCSLYNIEEKGNITGYIRWLHDVTKDRQYMREVMSLKEEADRASDAKGKFLAHMSHEIRTPINAVIGMDELILRETKESETRDYANQIMRAGKTLLSLINDILDFSKIEAGKMELVEDNYNLNMMLEDIIIMTRFRAEAKNLKLNLDVDHDLPAFLYGDETRVKQTITNIMTNAVKYTEKGSVTLSVYGTEKTDDKLNLIVKVTDTGIGIKKEDMAKLYSSFERIENETTHRTEGTGLGMSITLQLLRLMGGKLSVDSSYGKGSCFTISIPQKVTPPETAERLAGERAALSEGNGTGSGVIIYKPYTAEGADILIVDDNRANLMVASSLLKKTKIRIDTASSGSEFIEAIKNKHYDLVLLDNRMPDMDGIEAFKTAASIDHKSKGSPVIMMTADADPDSKQYFLSHGLSGYISKPLDPKYYESMVGSMLPPEKVKYY